MENGLLKDYIFNPFTFIFRSIYIIFSHKNIVNSKYQQVYIHAFRKTKYFLYISLKPIENRRTYRFICSDINV